MKGFDYLIGMGNEQGNSGGTFDRRNYIIYGDSVHGENYQHEIARLINPTYPNAHILFIQGINITPTTIDIIKPNIIDNADLANINI